LTSTNDVKKNRGHTGATSGRNSKIYRNYEVRGMRSGAGAGRGDGRYRRTAQQKGISFRVKNPRRKGLYNGLWELK